MRYQKLGTIKKRKGLQLYEYIFNEGLLSDGVTEVFISKKPKKENEQGQSSGQNNTLVCEGCHRPPSKCNCLLKFCR